MISINPIIQITKEPINRGNSLSDYKEQNYDLYLINVSENKLKMSFIGLENDFGELLISKTLLLVISGFDKGVKYPPDVKDGDICLDPSIKIDYFKNTLSLYDIKIKNLEMRSLNYFFTNDFSLGVQKEKELYKKIQETFKTIN